MESTGDNEDEAKRVSENTTAAVEISNENVVSSRNVNQNGRSALGHVSGCGATQRASQNSALVSKRNVKSKSSAGSFVVFKEGDKDIASEEYNNNNWKVLGSDSARRKENEGRCSS